MGHEVVIFGGIEGLAQDTCLELNRRVLEQLPESDEWPCLVRGMFAMPVEWPQGTYQSHIIHFGASFKDEPGAGGFWDTWLNKFESLLKQLYWDSATLHLKIEFGPDEVFCWRAVSNTVSGAWHGPTAVQHWKRSVRTFR